MKKLLAVVLTVVLTAVSALAAPLAVRADGAPATGAEAFVLYCVENQSIVLSKDENKRMRPASTTKLMTTLLTLEEAAKNDRVVTFTRDMIAEGSSMYLEVGEKVRLSDLATGMMMCSGNDAANAAATAIAGSTEKFSVYMNNRAKQLGMENTHFVTPSGLDDDDHYTTAYDLALLMQAGLRNEAFANLTYQKSASVRFAEPSDKTVTYNNHNRLLRLYNDCIGGKTGYTTAAGRCLVSAARRNGVTLICVTLNDKTDWDDHIALCDYGFERLRGYHSADSEFCLTIPCVGGEQDTVAVIGEKDVTLVTENSGADEIRRTVFLDAFVYAPVREGEALGRIEYTRGEKSLCSVALVAAEDVAEQRDGRNIFQKIKEFFTYG